MNYPVEPGEMDKYLGPTHASSKSIAKFNRVYLLYNFRCGFRYRSEFTLDQSFTNL